MSLILAALLTASTPAYAPLPRVEDGTNISAIRFIACDGGFGTGFVVDDNIVVTAAHVAENGNCKDAGTGASYVPYVVDKEGDLALLTGNTYSLPPLKYSCNGYKPGETYYSYGITNVMAPEYILRKFPVKAVRYELIIIEKEDGSRTATSNFMRLEGFVLSGHSGGPITDSKDVVVGINNTGQEDRMGLPYPNGGSVALKDTVLCKG